MSAFVDAIATHLTNAGVAESGWEVDKLGSQPTPHQTITIYETGGPEPTGKDRRVRRPSFQIVTRAGPGAAQAASDKAHAVIVALDGASVGGFGLFIATASAPITIGPDEVGRPMFVTNFRGMTA